MIANQANLTLAVPGDSGSLSAYSNIVIDNSAPTMVAASSIAGTNLITINLSEALDLTQDTRDALLQGLANSDFVVTNNLEKDFLVTVTGVSTSDNQQSLILALDDYIKNSAILNVVYSANPKVPLSDSADNIIEYTTLDSNSITLTQDTNAAQVTSVASDYVGPFKAGDSKNPVKILIKIEFDKVVELDGSKSATLSLDVGNGIANAIYKNGSGSDTLIFEYTVVQGNYSSALNYLSPSALQLSSGTTITDLAGNSANINLPPVSSLEFNS